MTPVKGIHIPKHGQHRYTEFQIFLPCSEWRTDIGWIDSGYLIKFVVCLLDFFTRQFPWNFVQLYMIIRMISDQVPLLLHLPDQFLISLDIFSHNKKGCLNPSFFQSFQKQGRIFGTWSVIKSQCYSRMFHGCLHQPQHPFPGYSAGCRQSHFFTAKRY